MPGSAAKRAAGFAPGVVDVAAGGFAVALSDVDTVWLNTRMASITPNMPMAIMIANRMGRFPLHVFAQ